MPIFEESEKFVFAFCVWNQNVVKNWMIIWGLKYARGSLHITDINYAQRGMCRGTDGHWGPRLVAIATNKWFGLSGQTTLLLGGSDSCQSLPAFGSSHSDCVEGVEMFTGFWSSAGSNHEELSPYFWLYTDTLVNLKFKKWGFGAGSFLTFARK